MDSEKKRGDERLLLEIAIDDNDYVSIDQCCYSINTE